MHSRLLFSSSVFCLSLTAALPVRDTSHGLLDRVAGYPRWLGEGKAPWDCSTGSSNEGSDAIPATGAVRSYDFTISRATLSPDGVAREMIVVNNQFPGPLLEANWGDIVEVTVFNNITGPEEPTSLHYHGVLQSQTPWSDGTPGVSRKGCYVAHCRADREIGFPMPDSTRQLLHVPLPSGQLRHVVLPLALQRAVHGGGSRGNSDLWPFIPSIRHRSGSCHVLGLGKS